MKTYVKYALYALGAVVVLFAGVIAYIAATFDPNAYKSDIVRLVQEETGRTMSIEGDIELRFFPKIGMSLGRTRLSERGSEAEFAGVDDLRVSLALLPLLSQKVVVDEIVIDGLRARLIRRADGSTNIDDLTSGRGGDDVAAEAQPADQREAAPMQLDVQGIRLVNSAFTYQDEQAGATYEVSELGLETGRIAEGVPTEFEYSALIRASEPKLDVRTRASGILNLAMADQVMRVSELNAQAEGAVATISGLKLTASASAVEVRTGAGWIGLDALSAQASGRMGEDSFDVGVEVPRLVLDKNAVAAQELVATLRGTVAGTAIEEALVTVPALDMDVSSQKIDVTGLAMTAAGQRGQDRFSVKLDAPRLAITPEDASGDAIEATLQARGPQLRADATLRLAGVKGAASALRVAEAVLEVDAEQADSAVKGRMSTPVNGDLKAQRFSLPKLTGQYELRAPALPMASAALALSGRVDADLNSETIALDLKTRFDESNIDGVFKMQTFADPYFRFEAAIDRLNLDRYTGKATQTTAPAGGGGEKKSPTIDLSPLKGLNLDGKLRIGTLTASSVKMTDVRVDVHAAGGKVRIDPLLANLYGGTVRSVVTADADTNQFAVKQSLSGVTVGPLLQDALNQDLIDGRGSVELDLTAQGDTLGALTKTLTGNAGLSLKDGAIKGINLAQSLRGAKDMLSLKRDQEAVASAAEKTDFSDLSASFRIDNGQARNEDLSLSSPFIRLNGSGSLNLVEGSLDYVAKTSLVATSTGQDGKALGELAGVTVPVHVSGPLSALKYKLEFSDAVQSQVKQRIKAEETRLKEKVESQLTEKLLGGEESASEPAEDDAAPAAPTSEPQEELKKRLKDLLR